jgi:hypothetical protein
MITKNVFVRLFFTLNLIFGGVLLMINIYGLNQPIRPNLDPDQDLRFENDMPLTFEQTMAQLDKLQQQDDQLLYMEQLTALIAKGLAHIHWLEEDNPDKFNQRVPIWENYILFAMSYLTSIPEYTKYHFMDPTRSLKRGIGICGDASMVTSQLLDEKGISNQIITFRGHVVVEAHLDDNLYLLDSDYGVFMPFGAQQLADNPASADFYYRGAGYNLAESLGIQQIYSTPYMRWNGTSHFVTKKYYFEPISYALKWLLPLILIIGSILYFRRKSV